MTSPIDAVGPTATLPANYDPSSAKVNATGTGKQSEMFDPEMFLNLLVAQLKYQDPTNPTDTSQFMTQSATLSQVQSMNSMSDMISQMVTAQQTTSATSMIGKAISFVDPSGKQSSGIVEGVSFSGGAAMLHVGSLAVPLSGVLAIADPVAVGAGSGAGTADGSGTDPGTDAGGTGSSTGTDSASDTTGTPATDGSSATGNDGAPTDSGSNSSSTTAGAPAATTV